MFASLFSKTAYIFSWDYFTGYSAKRNIAKYDLPQINLVALGLSSLYWSYSSYTGAFEQ